MAFKDEKIGGGSGEILSRVRAVALAWGRRRVDYDTAQDLASEVMSYVWDRMRADPGFLRGDGELEPYVIAAVRDAMLKRVRGDQRRSAREGEYTMANEQRERVWMSPDKAAEFAALMKAYTRAMARKSRRRRKAFELTVEEELSCRAVAKRLGISVRAVESRIRRTKQELRVDLAEFRTKKRKAA